jgi:MoaA/NifB/PqqE/SkfB family radical SAM enzyme
VGYLFRPHFWLVVCIKAAEAIMTARTINGMINAIERLHCIRKIWNCKAGWGMMFVRDFEEPHPPIFAKYTMINETHKYFAKLKEHSDKLLLLSEQNQVVYSYYPTLEACVKAEYQKRVVNREGLP